jgi:hypothetical protein|nr:MAG TPA: Protein of unknown function (DUF3164) [Caudoviricetes sp.]
MKKEMLEGLSAQEKQELLATLQREANEEKNNRRQAYEELREKFAQDVQARLNDVVTAVTEFREWLENESRAFRDVMAEYGQLRSESQGGFTMTVADFRLTVAANKVKGFDERADMAAERLVDYLKRYVQCTEKGTDDPMYQLAMTLLERNKSGDLDYKSISKLYDLETRFDAEYAEIMQLFKESNVIQRNAQNFYFHRRDDVGVWRKVEPSFCRM